MIYIMELYDVDTWCTYQRVRQSDWQKTIKSHSWLGVDFTKTGVFEPGAILMQAKDVHDERPGRDELIIEYKQWLVDNEIACLVMNKNEVWIFENMEDALMFKLRWI